MTTLVQIDLAKPSSHNTDLLLKRSFVLPLVGYSDGCQLVWGARAEDLDEHGFVSAKTLESRIWLPQPANGKKKPQYEQRKRRYLHGSLKLLDIVVQRGVHKCKDGSLKISAELLIKCSDDVLAILDLVRLAQLEFTHEAGGKYH